MNETRNTIKKLALVQGKWRGDADATVAWYDQVVRENVSPGTIVILPELCHTPYFPVEESTECFDWAVSNEHPYHARFSALAAETSCAVIFPFFEKRAAGIYHNTVTVFDCDGNVAGMYRKSHIPDDPGFFEKFYFHPGDTGIRPIQTSLGRLGVLICWDQWFPEAARIMSLRGAEILIYPTAIGWDTGEPESVYEDQLTSWQLSMQGHAVANGTYVAAVNRTGIEGPLRFWGNSFVAGPTGRILTRSAEAAEGVFQIALDINAVEEQRRMWPFFRDRRIDQYEDLLRRWIDP